ncbi:MAG: hypothetical protein R6U98_07795 [Pirellulaceae bacterium]
MERCPAQVVLPLVGLVAEKVIRDRYSTPGTYPFEMPQLVLFATANHLAHVFIGILGARSSHGPFVRLSQLAARTDRLLSR